MYRILVTRNGQETEVDRYRSRARALSAAAILDESLRRTAGAGFGRAHVVDASGNVVAG